MFLFSEISEQAPTTAFYSVGIEGFVSNSKAAVAILFGTEVKNE